MHHAPPLEIRQMPVFEHSYAFDPIYGYDMEALLKIRHPEFPPADFAAFWRETMAEASAQTRVIEQKSLPPPSSEWQLDLLKIQTLDRSAFGAWLLKPKDPSHIRRAFVVGHGYGGRAGIDWPVAFQDAVYIFPSAHGFFVSEAPGLPNSVDKHVVHGIASRETYLIRHCVAALQSAAEVLAEFYPEFDGQLGYQGVSFGGGLGALMLPWSKSFSRAFLKVPTFGHHPLRLKCPCVGSGEAVRLLEQRDSSIRKTLAYFDAATSAAEVKIPVLVSAALFDPAVPPPGQFAVANALGGPKQLHVLSASHFEHPSLLLEEQALAGLMRQWFLAPHL